MDFLFYVEESEQNWNESVYGRMGRREGENERHMDTWREKRINIDNPLGGKKWPYYPFSLFTGISSNRS